MLQASSTLKRYKKGDKREDGFLFQGYTNQTEIWLSPKSYNRDRINSCMHKAKVRAEEASFPYDLTIEYLIEIFPGDMKCPVFGIQMFWGKEGGIETSPSLDRIVPALGYVKGNVIWISRYANRLKSDHTLDTLRTLLAFYENLERRNE